jgi:flavin-binding protein dodecin
MLQMLEVIGVSDRSHSEAVRQAIERLIASGEEVHFFEVIEQRGSVRNGKIEFQAKIKAAVDSEKQGNTGHRQKAS